MDLQNREKELLSAWRAFDCNQTHDGWSTISLGVFGDCNILAGRYFPSNVEAILFGFSNYNIPTNLNLPKSNGFTLEKIVFNNSNYLCLVRSKIGSLDFFTFMVIDILSVIERLPFLGQNSFNLIIERVNSWQNFMERSETGVLSKEEELGLIGELIILLALLKNKLPLYASVNSWAGPLNNLHDFIFKVGVIEVKTSIFSDRQVLIISSIDQLDEDMNNPIFLAHVSLKKTDTGLTLPKIVEKMRSLMCEDQYSLLNFNTKLISAGFYDEFQQKYKQHYSVVTEKFYMITNSFPHFTRRNLPIEIIDAKYKIDVGLVKEKTIKINDVLKLIGV